MSKNKNPLAVQIGKALRETRLANDFSVVDLAAELSIHPDAISHYENGDRVPSLPNLLKYSRYFHCYIDDLIN